MQPAPSRKIEDPTAARPGSHAASVPCRLMRRASIAAALSSPLPSSPHALSRLARRRDPDILWSASNLPLPNEPPDVNHALEKE